MKRYKTYVRLLQYKLAAFTELEPSLAETVIGEVDEPSTSPGHETAHVQFDVGQPIDTFQGPTLQPSGVGGLVVNADISPLDTLQED